MKKLLLYWFPFVAHMGLIFYLSSRSSFPVEMPWWAFHADKVVHGVFFGFLSFLLIRAWLYGNYRLFTWKVGSVAVLFTAFYGLTDEFHQSFVPGRSPDVYDILADASGALIVCAVVYVVINFVFPRSLGVAQALTSESNLSD